MTRAISSSPPTPRLAATAGATPPDAAAPFPADQAARVSGDTLTLGGVASPPLLEADLNLKLTVGAKLLANGTITFSRTFLERLLNHVLGKGKTFSNAQVSFDPTQRAYTVRATAHVKGFSVPFTVALKPDVVGQGVGFKLEDLRIPLSERFGIQNRWLTNKVAEVVADELRYSLGARAQGGTVTFSPNALLHHVNALPTALSLDLAQIQMATSVAPAGELTLSMRADGLAEAVDGTADSDFSLEADAKGLESLLRRLLAPDYEVNQVTLRDGKAKIEGKAEFKDGSNLVNAGKLLIALIGLSGGEIRAAELLNEPSRMMVPLDLDLRFEGTQLVVTPSLRQALGELSKTLESAGLKPVLEGNSLRVNLDDVLGGRGGLDGLQITADALKLKAQLDLEAFIRNPALTNG